ncbi:hypothetical protein D3C73_1427590 [compost metagenome]
MLQIKQSHLHMAEIRMVFLYKYRVSLVDGSFFEIVGARINRQLFRKPQLPQVPLRGLGAF